MLNTEGLPTLSTEICKTIYYKGLVSVEEQGLIEELETVRSATQGYMRVSEFKDADIGIIPLAQSAINSWTIADSSYVDLAAEPFMILSKNKKSIDFVNLLKTDAQGLIPKKLFKKLQEILADLRKTEPGLFNFLLKMNNKIDIDHIISILEFVGAESLPKNVNIERLFEEAKSTFANGK